MTECALALVWVKIVRNTCFESGQSPARGGETILACVVVVYTLFEAVKAPSRSSGRRVFMEGIDERLQG